MTSAIEHSYLEPQEAAWNYLQKIRTAGFHFHGATVLDAGCGSGVYAKLMADNGAALAHGVDASRQNILMAGELGSRDNLAFILSDIQEYQPEILYDAVFSRGVVYYFKDIHSILNNYSQFLKPSGLLYVSFLEKTPGAIAVNTLKHLASLLPERRRPLFRDLLAATYYLLQGKKDDGNSQWSIVRNKMNTIFFPAENLFTPETALRALSNTDFEVVAVLPRLQVFGGGSDFGVLARKRPNP